MQNTPSRPHVMPSKKRLPAPSQHPMSGSPFPRPLFKPWVEIWPRKFPPLRFKGGEIGFASRCGFPPVPGISNFFWVSGYAPT